MRQLIATGITALNTFAILNLPTLARAEDNHSCIVAINNAQKQIEAGRPLKVTIRTFDISKGYPDHPKNRPNSYVFAMKGEGASTVIRSPKFMKAITTNVIQNCGSVSIVRIAVWESDNVATFGLLPGGKVDAFQCVESQGRNSPKLSWGQEFCI